MHITTFSGAINLDRMNDYKVELVDIASGLGKSCRYGGQCNQFYSVAEHSVRMAHLVIKSHRFRIDHGIPHMQSATYAMHALLHDAAEAYLGDMVRPVKYLVPAFTEKFKELEAEFMELIYHDLLVSDGISISAKGVEHEGIKALDNYMIPNEMARLCGGLWRNPSAKDLTGFDEPMRVTKQVEDMGLPEIRYWAPDTAAMKFMHAFYEIREMIRHA